MSQSLCQFMRPGGPGTRHTPGSAPPRTTVPKTKKQLILEYCQQHGLDTASGQGIRRLQAELGRLCEGARPSLSYIANVLREAGARVDFDSRFVDPWMEEPYATRLKGTLQFSDLETAEAALRSLDAAYREYQK